MVELKGKIMSIYAEIFGLKSFSKIEASLIKGKPQHIIIVYETLSTNEYTLYKLCKTIFGKEIYRIQRTITTTGDTPYRVRRWRRILDCEIKYDTTVFGDIK